MIATAKVRVFDVIHELELVAVDVVVEPGVSGGIGIALVVRSSLSGDLSS